MSPVEAARRLVGLEGWVWDDRMTTPDLATDPTGGTTRVDIGGGFAISVRVPDLDDDATRGIVLGMLSRRVGAYCWIRPAIGGWTCLRDEPTGLFGHIASGPSWAAAFVAAWEATPRPA